MIARIAFALLWLSCGTSFASEASSPGAVPERTAGTRTTIVSEPVFNGTVFISEAGRENPLTVLLIHGSGEEFCARSWDKVIPELAKHYHVVTFDLPGFCRSSKQNALYSPERYADFVKWVATTRAKGKYIVIGHSMGGAIALRFAAKYPADLLRLVIVDAAGILHRAAFTKYALRVKERPDAFPLLDLGTKMVNLLSGSAVERLEYLGSPVDLDMLIASEFLRQKLLGADPVKISAVALMQENFSQALETIRTPTSIIWSTDDDVAPLRTAKVLAAKLPNSRLELIADAGHTPMLSRPEQFSRLVLDELSRPNQEYRPARLASVPTGNTLDGKCSQQDDMIFSGTYRKIDIDRCNRAKLANVTTESLTISGSDGVMMENSRIEGKALGMNIQNSEISLTNVTIKADTAIAASNSNLDLAGVELQGIKAAATTVDSSSLLFSLSKVNSPHVTGYLHGLFTLTPDRPL